jgi:uncharacterized Tic20 family protein
MTETTPPPSPSDVPPPIEVHAEPARSDDRGRVFQAASSASAPPPSSGARGGPTSTVYGGQGAGSGPAAATSGAPASKASTSGWATFCHLVALVDFGFTFLFVGLIATLVLWLIKKDSDAEADYHGKEALNFQLNVVFWQIAAFPLLLCCIGFLMIPLLPIAKVVLMIIAAIHAANGERWRYPFIFRVLR